MGLTTAKMLLDGSARVLVTVRSQAGLESAQKELLHRFAKATSNESGSQRAAAAAGRVSAGRRAAF